MRLVSLLLIISLALRLVSSNSCEHKEVKPIRSLIDVSNVPEVSNGKLRICMQDDPNFSLFLPYMQPYVLMPYSMLVPNSIRGYFPDVSRALASTLVGRSGRIIDADIFMFNDLLIEDVNTVTLDSSYSLACLRGLKDGICDVAICDTLMTKSLEATYNISWIEEKSTKYENVVVYPRSSACDTVQLSNFCGRRVYVKHGSVEHDEVSLLNSAGNVCADSNIDIRAHALHFDHFKLDCHNTTDENPCYLLGSSHIYWSKVCTQTPPEIGSDYTNCDTARLVLQLYGTGWATRDTDEVLHRAITLGRDTLAKAKYISREPHEYAYLESKWNRIHGLPCHDEKVVVNGCATLSACAIPSDQKRCLTTCLNPNRCGLGSA